MRGLTPGAVLLGGQSYGGRQATLLAADEPGLVEALVLFSYPLHPPGKPERLRTEHFPRLAVPCVFVHGTSDPFGSLAELEAAIAAIPAATRLIPVQGAGHDLKRGRFDLGRGRRRDAAAPRSGPVGTTPPPRLERPPLSRCGRGAFETGSTPPQDELELTRRRFIANRNAD